MWSAVVLLPTESIRIERIIIIILLNEKKIRIDDTITTEFPLRHHIYPYLSRETKPTINGQGIDRIDASLYSHLFRSH
jgi:hypothetical protein